MYSNCLCLLFHFVNFTDNVGGKKCHLWASDALLEKRIKCEKILLVENKNLEYYDSILVQVVQSWEVPSR